MDLSATMRGPALAIALGVYAYACGGSRQSPAAGVACPCVGPAAVELSQPTREHVLEAMLMARDEVESCSDEGGALKVYVAFDGTTGEVADAQVVGGTEDDAVKRCVEHALQRICLPRFRQPVFKIQFPYRMGSRDRRAQSWPAPRCPPSAVRSGFALNQAQVREAYQEKYGQACERTLTPPTVPQDPVLLLPASAAPIDRETKHAVLQARIDDIQNCYHDALVGWPALQGELQLEVVVAADGKVEHSRVVTSTFTLPELGCCLRQVVHSLSFPPTSDGGRSTTTYDFAFSP